MISDESRILNRLMTPEAQEAFYSGKESGLCPRCGGFGDCEESDGAIEDGWYRYSYQCTECETRWDETFEFEPKPVEIAITEIPQQRESSEEGYYSWKRSMELDEVEEMVEAILAEE